MNKYKLIGKILLVLTAVVSTACHNSNVGSEEGILVLEDGEQSLSRFLINERDPLEGANFWMCTFVNNEVFESRQSLHFWEDGEGVLEDTPFVWEVSSDEVTVVEQGGSEYVLSDIVFTNRVHVAHHFEANLGSERRLTCDWTGPPRQLLAFDDFSAPELSLFELTEGDGLETLLPTGTTFSDFESYWQCSGDGVAAEWRMFQDNNFYSEGSGVWFAQGDDTLIIIPEGGAQQNYRIVFPFAQELIFNRFQATLLDGSELTTECVRAGQALAEIVE